MLWVVRHIYRSDIVQCIHYLHTWVSKSLSHMSLIVQPAPLMMREPAPNRDRRYKSGREPGAAAKDMLHVQGRYNSHVPAV